MQSLVKYIIAKHIIFITVFVAYFLLPRAVDCTTTLDLIHKQFRRVTQVRFVTNLATTRR